MAYSSNFTLDPDGSGRPSRSGRSSSARRGSDARPERLRPASVDGGPRTTNRITVSGKEPRISRRLEGDAPDAGARRSARSGSYRSDVRTGRSSDRFARGQASSRTRSSGPAPQRTRQGQDRQRRTSRTASYAAVQSPERPQRAGGAGSSGTSKLFDILKLLLLGLLHVIALAGRGIGRVFLALWGKSRILGCALTVALVLGAGFLIDSALTADKVYQGVKVGDVDVGGMTQQEAADAISARYADKLANTSVYIFTSEEAARDTDVTQVQMQEQVLAEQISVEDALENKVLWVESSDTLGARLPVQELAAEAYEFGRSTGMFDRFSTLMRAHEIPARLDYNPTMLDKLVSDLDTAIGTPAQESGISIQDGTASVVEGHDGYEIDEAVFQGTLTDKLLNSEVDDPRYIPVAEYVTLKVDAASAQKTADAVNQALEEGASFDLGDASTDISKETLGSWVEAAPAERDGEWYLKPTLSEKKALETLTGSLNLEQEEEPYAVSFQVGEDGVSVSPSQEISIPNVGTALEGLDQALFGSFCEAGVQQISGDRFDIPIQTQRTSGPLSLDEALAYGVVTKFSTYTTQFNSTSSTMNRMYNIQKAADLINDSVVGADGGRWSFNETAGDCNAEAGFKEAGVISGDEMTQEAGGGICQVATTVFNAVYESGLPIIERHNHSLISTSYPAGRDAAIAYPTLDLVWENDGPSDVLLTTSYTSTSVTVNLIGEDPDLTVTTEVGDWEEGDPYKVKVEVDDTYAPTAVVKMTAGSDGKTIEVTRTVKNAQGDVVGQQVFSSVYSPTNELYKVGSEVDAAEVQRKHAREDDPSASTANGSSGGSGSSGSSPSSST